MKNIILVMILSLALNVTITQAAAVVGSGFTYQGELIDNGAPANGDYDVQLDLFLVDTGGSSSAVVDYLNITVTNGLFTIEDVDFGDAVYADSNQFYIEVAVRPAGVGSYTILTPRQRLQAVPYAVQAEFLAPGGASNGDVLQFNGSDWVAAAASGASPWNQSGITLTSPGKVGIGEPTPSAQLHVTNNQSQISLLKVDDVSDTRFIVQATGRTGIGAINPAARLHVSSSVNEDPLRVQVDGGTKLRVFANGGTSLGANFGGTPDNGLYVQGDSKQESLADGMMKYMVRANCGTATNIVRSYNGTNVAGSISATAGAVLGRCTFTFPTNVSARYFQATAMTDSGNSRVGCYFPNANQLSCRRMTASSGTPANGPIMVLIY